MLSEADSSTQKKSKNTQELLAKKKELVERIKNLEKQLLECELR